MAVDMFIKIGDVKGESKDKTHAEEIDVLAWSWGMSQSGSMHMGGGGGAGKVPNRGILVLRPSASPMRCVSLPPSSCTKPRRP